MKNLLPILITLVSFTSYCQSLDNIELRGDINTVVYKNTECINCPITYDTIIFRKLRCGLYINNKNDIAYQSSMLLNDFDRGVRYISWIYGVDKNDSLNGGLQEMKYVIDTNTFKFYSHTYWGDKNKIYGFTPMSDGETPYAWDKKHVFYKGDIIGADPKTFKIVLDEGLPELAKDKNGYIYSGQRITLEQLEELKE